MESVPNSRHDDPGSAIFILWFLENDRKKNQSNIVKADKEAKNNQNRKCYCKKVNFFVHHKQQNSIFVWKRCLSKYSCPENMKIFDQWNVIPNCSEIYFRTSGQNWVHCLMLLQLQAFKVGEGLKSPHLPVFIGSRYK